MKHIIAYEGKSCVSLGLLQEEYAPYFVPWANRRIDIEGTRMRPPYWQSNFVEWVRELSKNRGRSDVFAILLKTRGRYTYVGHTGIHEIEWPGGWGRTGSLIGVRAAQGRGVGTEAKLWLMYHAFSVLGLRKLVSDVKGFNIQSAGHLLKSGYRFVGRYQNHIPHNGGYVDELVFEAFPEDWRPIWNRYQASGTLPKLTDEQRSFLNKEMCSS